MGSVNIHSLRGQPVERWLVEADETSLRSASRQIASCVCVITLDEAGELSGLTTDTVSFLAGDPATLVIGVKRGAPAYAALGRARRFALNVLGGDQREIAEHFAVETSAAPLDPAPWLAIDNGLVGLADCAAVFECEAEQTIERPAHAVVIARVRKGWLAGGSGGLVRWRGSYEPLGWSRDEISRAVGLKPRGEARERT